MRQLILVCVSYLNIFALCGFTPLKVLTLNFNSEVVPSDSHDRIRDLRYHALLDWIKKNDPDIVLMQEAWNYHDKPSVAVTLAKSLGYSVAYRLGMGVSGFLIDSDAILAKKRLKMTDERDVKLPHSAFEIGDGKTWVVCFGSVSWAVGVTLSGSDGKPIFVYSTHLIGSSLNDRRDQAVALANDVRKRATRYKVSWQNAQVIVGGDFNSQPSEPAPAYFTQSGYFDSFAVAHPENVSCSVCADYTQLYFDPTIIGGDLFPSQNGSTGDVRYDYIFSRGQNLRPLASTLVFSAPIDGTWMSDHYGLFSVFGDENSSPIPNPVRDTVYSEPSPPVIDVFDRDLYCADQSGFSCRNQMPPANPVWGASGFVVHNTSDFVVSAHVYGPGEIFTESDATLNPGESVDFTFKSPGTYNYVLQAVTVDNSYDAKAVGTVNVTAGY